MDTDHLIIPVFLGLILTGSLFIFNNSIYDDSKENELSTTIGYYKGALDNDTKLVTESDSYERILDKEIELKRLELGILEKTLAMNN